MAEKKAAEKKTAEEKKTARKSAEKRTRLDQPQELHRGFRWPTFDNDQFGKFAERFARYMGTANFLIYMTVLVVIWVLWNWIAPERLEFDSYPFIFLTLMLSLQASYAAPLILLAQNRQEDRDRVVAEGDRRAASQSHADMEFLAREMASLRIALSEVATRDYVRSELRALLAELEERAKEEEAESAT